MKKSTGHTHTPTENNTPVTHTPVKNIILNPQTNTPHKHLTYIYVKIQTMVGNEAYVQVGERQRSSRFIRILPSG